MSGMKEFKDELRPLGERINEVSRQVTKVLDIAQNLQEKYEQLENRHAQEEKSRKEGEWLLFRFGLIMGSLSGAITGLLISYLMKVYEAISIAPWMWLVSAIAIIVGYVVILVRIWKMKRPDSKPKQPLEILSVSHPTTVNTVSHPMRS